MMKINIFLIICGVISVLLILYFTTYPKKERISLELELDFYKDDVSPVYCLPWNAIPELHESVNKLIEIYINNLPKIDLYKIHDKLPEYKLRFDDADKNILQFGDKKMNYYTNVEKYLRDHTGKDSSRMIIENYDTHQLSDGKIRLNGSKHMQTYNSRNFFLNTNKGKMPIEITGTFYYPPGGFKEWHTNKTSANVPDWRIYFIYLTDPDTESYFCYINPMTGKFHRMRDKHMSFNMFYLNDKQERLLWHSVKCVTGGRVSFGLKINPYQIPGLVERLNLRPHIG